MKRTYNVPPKNAVRQAGMDFLPEDLSGRCGLYLPGWEALEEPLYLQKGVRRLIGVEHDPGTYEHLCQTLRHTTLLHGNVQQAVNWLLAEGECLHFANIDLESSYWTHISDILSVFRALPERESLYLTITSYSMRDAATIIEGYMCLSKFFASIASLDFHSQMWAMQQRYKNGVQKEFASSRVPPYKNMCRDLGLMWWLSLAVILLKRDEEGLRFCPERLKGLTPHFKAIRDMARGEEEMIETQEPPPIVYREGLAEALQELHVSRWITAFKRFVYLSGGCQLMHTWMFRIDPWPSSEPAPTGLDVVHDAWEKTHKFPIHFVREDGSITQIL